MSSRRRAVCVGQGSEQAAALLRDARIEGRTVATTADALDLVATAAVDCVVASPPLADADGLDFLRRVRADHPHFPFVLYPADGSEALASEAMAASVTDYVPQSGKNGDRLVEAVTNAIVTGQNRRTERVVDLVRRIQSTLVQARTAGEIDDGVCEAVADTEPYAFVWIGEYDETDEQVTPRASARA